ncbi:hypothetical protein [Bowdeniella massiliensis]|uniref:hypothetical protein n=1 Tax=Bowdeniella massiliensis TaxID=2932264 RepID=UPI002541ECBA|nr:hypothetical protein [Bowdeniella massiliensis]
MKRIFAAVGTAALGVGLLAGPAMAEPGYDSDQNHAWYWENVLAEKGYDDAKCIKLEEESDYLRVPENKQGGEWVLLVLKSATVNDQFWNPVIGEKYSPISGKRISHAFLCTGVAPTGEPSEEPTETPTEQPTEKPTDKPTEEPTEKPTDKPTDKPTEEPTEKPTDRPTEEPTEKPTVEPTHAPEPSTPGKPPKPTPEPELPVTGVPALGLLAAAALGLGGGGTALAVRRHLAK